MITAKKNPAGVRARSFRRSINSNKVNQQVDIVELKNRIRIPDVAAKLLPDWKPAKCCRSPVREDRKPSFSVFDDGKAFKDFATGESGSVIDFYCLVTGCDTATAIYELAAMAGITNAYSERLTRALMTPQISRLKPLVEEPDLALPGDLRLPTKAEVSAISYLRGVHLRATEILVSRCILFIGTYHNAECFIFVDNNQAEARRLDGKPFSKDRKVLSIKGSKKLAFGVEAAAHHDYIAVVEGTADLLAAAHFAWCRGVQDQVGFVAMPGAGVNFTSDQLLQLAGKRIRIFPDGDEPGLEAAKRWEQDLRLSLCRTDCFRVDGAPLSEGEYSNDLGDLARSGSKAIDDDPELLSPFDFVLEGGEQ